MNATLPASTTTPPYYLQQVFFWFLTADGEKFSANSIHDIDHFPFCVHHHFAHHNAHAHFLGFTAFSSLSHRLQPHFSSLSADFVFTPPCFSVLRTGAYLLTHYDISARRYLFLSRLPPAASIAIMRGSSHTNIENRHFSLDIRCIFARLFHIPFSFSTPSPLR